MIKAVTTILGLILLLNTAISLRAQTNPAETAEIEAVRRQEAIQLLHMKLLDAQALHKAGRFVEGAKAYEDAWALFPRVGLAGGDVELDKKAVVAGLVDVRLKLAEDARRSGNFMEADAQVRRALKVDPQNAIALNFKLQNDRAIAQTRGNVPSAEVMARVPEVQNEKIQTGTLVQDGKVLYEMGKLDDADLKLRLALQQDPTSTGAKYYLELIKEQRYALESRKRDLSARDALVEVEKAWNPVVKRDQLPFPNPALRNPQVHTSPQRQVMMDKLNTIQLNEVGYDGLPLVEVLKDLRDQSTNRDKDKNGLNFMIDSHSDAGSGLAAVPQDPNAPAITVEATIPNVDISQAIVKIVPPLRNLRLVDVLEAVVSASDQPIRYELRDYAVVFAPKAASPVQLHYRTFKVDPNTFMQGLESIVALSLGSSIGQSGGGGGGGGGAE
jgi:tetratricopeptide (TPR) repeat protein